MRDRLEDPEWAGCWPADRKLIARSVVALLLTTAYYCLLLRCATCAICRQSRARRRCRLVSQAAETATGTSPANGDAEESLKASPARPQPAGAAIAALPDLMGAQGGRPSRKAVRRVRRTPRRALRRGPGASCEPSARPRTGRAPNVSPDTAREPWLGPDRLAAPTPDPPGRLQRDRVRPPLPSGSSPANGLGGLASQAPPSARCPVRQVGREFPALPHHWDRTECLRTFALSCLALERCCRFWD